VRSAQGKKKQMSQSSNAEVGEEAVHVLERRPGIGALAVAGIVGPILFTVAFVEQGLPRLGVRSVAVVVIALEAGKNAATFYARRFSSVGGERRTRPRRLAQTWPVEVRHRVKR
jgi:hypothetical protein